MALFHPYGHEDTSPYVHTSGDSVISEIGAQEIASSADKYLYRHRKANSDAITGCKDVDVYDICTSAKHKLKVKQKTDQKVWCECGAVINLRRLSRNQKEFSCCIVIEDEEGNYEWVTIFSNVLRESGHFTEINPSPQQVEDELTNILNIKFELDEGKVIKVLQ